MTFRGIVRPLKTIGIVLAIVVSSYQIISWLRVPRTRLVAEVDYGDFRYPSALRNEIKELRNLAEDSLLASKLDMNYIDNDQINRDGAESVAKGLVSGLSLYLSAQIPYDIPRPYSLIHGYWSVLIRNGGNKTARTVSLILPYVVCSEVYREEGIAATETPPGILKFESLEPHEEVRIIAWTSMEPSAHVAKEIRFAHENGLGRIAVQIPTGSFWHWIESNLFFVLWSVIMIILLILSCPFWNAPLFGRKSIGSEDENTSNSACS